MIDTIILSGGASRGYYQLGCLLKYEDKLPHVKRYVGCSVGAIISLLLCIGYGPIKIMSMSLEITQQDRDWRDIATLMLHKHGMIEINPYVEMVRNMIMSKYGYIPTMQQLYDLTHKELEVVGSCLSTYETVYISHHTFPDMPCTIAIDISSRMPIYFTPILWEGMIYVDGGLGDHFPISRSRPDEKTLSLYACEKNLGSINYLSQISTMNYLWLLVGMGTKGHYTGLGSTSNMILHILKGKGGNMSASPKEALEMFLIGVLNHPEPVL